MFKEALSLSAKPGVWRLFSARKADPAFLTFSEKVWQRDDYTCQFCGFQAKDYQEVVNLDQDYSHNKLSNLVTACCFCAQCFFLEGVGKGAYGGGTLIYLTDMTQAELNGLSHVLFCAIANATDYRTEAQNIYRTLKMRSQTVEQNLGEGMSDPAMFGQLLIETGIEANNILAQLRLLPSRSKFATQIEAWAGTAYAALLPTANASLQETVT